MSLLFLKAWLAFLAFDLFGFDRNFPHLHKTVAAWPVANRTALPGTVERVCQAINHTCVWYPKRAWCLKRAAITTCLLRSSGIPAQFVLGSQHIPFRAHAWVEVDNRPINERTDVHRTYLVCDRC
jgi:hypothetical protein